MYNQVTTSVDPNISEILVGNKFLEIFKDVPGVLLDQEIEFPIDLVPGITPMSKATYRMTIVELAKLKVNPT